MQCEDTPNIDRRFPIGRATMNDAPEEPRRDNENKSSFRRASNMLEQLPQTDQEVEALRNAVMTKEGLLLSVFDILRNMPRRVLMVFKLNDLTRFDTVHNQTD